MATIWPKALRKVAVKTNILMRGNPSWVHDRMREWAEANYSRLIAQERRETCRHEAFANVLSNPRLRDKKAGPPKKGWVWKTGYAPLRDRTRNQPRPAVTGWIPPEAAEAIEFTETGDPLLEGRPSDLPYKVVRLAALCTACLATEDPIIPPEWSGIGADKRDSSAAIPYDVWVLSSHDVLVDIPTEERTDAYADKLELYRLDVKDAMREAGAVDLSRNDAQQAPPEDLKPTLSKEALAIAALKDHPGWTNQEIAKAAGCHPKSLHRFDDFMKAREILRQATRASIPKGSKSKDGEMEAWEGE